MRSRLAIVVIAYNRKDAFLRLYNQLIKSVYSEPVDLIISIDKSNTDAVEQCAKSLTWQYGNIEVKTFKKNLGLKEHVLTCGNYSKDYEAIIVFEDDIVPSKYFFQYSVEALKFYENNDSIAGISLYQHLWNTNANYAFIPDNNINYDNFFMQFAPSWGQIWSKEQWSNFYSWYLNNKESFYYVKNVPQAVCDYSEKSWLKFFTRYIIENNKFFVYPYVGLSTNFSDAGTHNTTGSTHYQIPILNYPVNKFKFSPFDQDAILYDAYHERLGLGKYLGYDESDLCVDLYGTKEELNKYKYLISLEKKEFKIVEKFALSFKPHELNIINELDGEDIFVYDLTVIEKNQFMVKNVSVKRLFYSNRDIKIPQLASMTVHLILIKFKVLPKFINRRIKTYFNKKRSLN